MRLFTLSVMLLALLSACNTVQGIGRDIETLGDGISRTAEESKR